MSNQDTISNFYSTTKFVNFIKDTYPNNEFTKFDNKDYMYVLVIEFESKAFMNSTYYPSHVLLCKNEHNIKCIRDQFKINYDDGNVPVSCFI
ncbi:hypothetical protein M9Y10_017139 [Tritrichomonas musculus]|uniref:Uncharacterized protein n=1 Tax=Tritrichomonas musculus TaxID=1915356 RepID=A0ABR2HV95_9EUKA